MDDMPTNPGHTALKPTVPPPAQPVPPAPLDGEPTRQFPLLFDRYRIVRELGRGGMGQVLLARDEELDQPVAIKIIPDMVMKDNESVNDLKKEVLRGMALTHPGIVRTHTFERDANGAAIVMEYIEGLTLQEMKSQQPEGCFSPEEIFQWIEQFCAVLDYAHGEARIVHRDLKPRNLMLTKSGRLKVADFGISAMLSETVTRNTSDAMTSGTPSYMSPQQAMGKKPSPLDDIYALGATIYELLTGKPPFFRGQILAQVISETPVSMTERRGEFGITGLPPIPEIWEKTIAACLAKEPEDRPQTAREVLARLKGAEVEIGRTVAGITLGELKLAADAMQPTMQGTPLSEADLAALNAMTTAAAEDRTVPNYVRLPDEAPARSRGGTMSLVVLFFLACGVAWWGLGRKAREGAQVNEAMTPVPVAIVEQPASAPPPAPVVQPTPALRRTVAQYFDDSPTPRPGWATHTITPPPKNGQASPQQQMMFFPMPAPPPPEEMIRMMQMQQNGQGPPPGWNGQPQPPPPRR